MALEDAILRLIVGLKFTRKGNIQTHKHACGWWNDCIHPFSHTWMKVKNFFIIHFKWLTFNCNLRNRCGVPLKRISSYKNCKKSHWKFFVLNNVHNSYVKSFCLLLSRLLQSYSSCTSKISRQAPSIEIALHYGKMHQNTV